jgi:hypothetical protein
VALGIMCMLLDDGMKEIVSKQIEAMVMFSDYVSGGSVIAAGALLGWLLLRSPAMPRNAAEPEQRRPA